MDTITTDLSSTSIDKRSTALRDDDNIPLTDFATNEASRSLRISRDSVYETHDWSPLFQFIQQGELAKVMHMVTDYPYLLTRSDHQGNNLVHLASFSGKLDIVKYLLSVNQALARIVNMNGELPLHRACLGNKLEVVKYFLEVEEIDIDSKCSAIGWAPMHCACFTGDVKMVKYLVTSEASVKSKDNTGVTPLHLAAYFGHLPVVRYLINLNPKLKDAKNYNGCSVVDSVKLSTICGAQDVFNFLKYH